MRFSNGLILGDHLGKYTPGQLRSHPRPRRCREEKRKDVEQRKNKQFFCVMSGSVKDNAWASSDDQPKEGGTLAL